MNQILNTEKKKKNLKQIFKMQFFISVICIMLGMIYWVKIMKEKERENSISKTISMNAKLNSVFAGNEKTLKQDVYFGRIICEKINLDYFVYNQYSEENLKILPCKFSGGSLQDNGNICIIGHNYFDNRFFSNLNQLEIGDKILLKDLEEKKYFYEVFRKYEINEKDIQSVVSQETQRELTLCTCTYKKEKRLIIKAKNI